MNLRETVVWAHRGKDLARCFRIALPMVLALSLAAGLAPQGTALSQENKIHLGSEGGVFVLDEERDCGTLMMHNEGEYYDGAYTWAYDGVVPPYYGAFAYLELGVADRSSRDVAELSHPATRPAADLCGSRTRLPGRLAGRGILLGGNRSAGNRSGGQRSAHPSDFGDLGPDQGPFPLG